MKFNHDNKSVALAMGITEERGNYLQAFCYFSHFNQDWMAKNLFDDPSQAPLNLVTRTGCLETIFNDVTLEEERIYCTYEYFKLISFAQMPILGERLLLKLENMFLKSSLDFNKFHSLFIKDKQEALNDEEEDC